MLRAETSIASYDDTQYKVRATFFAPTGHAGREQIVATHGIVAQSHAAALVTLDEVEVALDTLGVSFIRQPEAQAA